MYNKAQEIIDTCKKNNISIYQLVLNEEIKNTKKTEDEIRSYLDQAINVMIESAESNLNKSSQTTHKMIDGYSKLTYAYAQNNETITGKFCTEAMAMALSTSEINSSMGKIIAAPTAGSAGIIPAMLVSAKNRYGFDNFTLQNGLLTANAIGHIISKYATFAGAEGGCQAECGSASAMASAGLLEMLDASPEQILTAASITLINVLGLVCDPIAGLVQYPCNFRNASGVMNAFLSADLALAGAKSIVPFEEVVQAMGEVGHSLHESLRETGIGGLAGTETGQKIRKNFLNLED